MKKLKESQIKKLLEVSKEFDEICQVEALAYQFGDFLDFGCSWYCDEKELAEGNETKAAKQMLIAFHRLRKAIDKRKQEVARKAATIIAKR